MATKRGKRKTRSVKGLKTKSVSAGKAKSVRGGALNTGMKWNATQNLSSKIGHTGS